MVISDEVRVKRAAVSHGNLTITISEQEGAVQPLPFSQGRTVPTQSSGVDVSQQTANMMVWPEGAPRPILVNNLARLSRGEMIGVKFNKDKTWVGGSVGFYENE